jgi:hypothetical protein
MEMQYLRYVKEKRPEEIMNFQRKFHVQIHVNVYVRTFVITAKWLAINFMIQPPNPNWFVGYLHIPAALKYFKVNVMKIK